MAEKPEKPDPLEELTKQFVDVSKRLEVQLKKLPQALEEHRKLAYEARLLMATHKAAGPSGSAEGRMSPETVKTCMEVICSFADLLDLQDKSRDNVNALESAKKMKRDLELDLGKMEMIRGAIVQTGKESQQSAQNRSADFDYSTLKGSQD